MTSAAVTFLKALLFRDCLSHDNCSLSLAILQRMVCWVLETPEVGQARGSCQYQGRKLDKHEMPSIAVG